MPPRVWEVEGVPPPKAKISDEEIAAARVPHAYRDYCAHLMIKLNECRAKSKFAPWACKHEKHDYFKCQYLEVRYIAFARGTRAWTESICFSPGPYASLPNLIMMHANDVGEGINFYDINVFAGSLHYATSRSVGYATHRYVIFTVSLSCEVSQSSRSESPYRSHGFVHTLCHALQTMDPLGD